MKSDDIDKDNINRSTSDNSMQIVYPGTAMPESFLQPSISAASANDNAEGWSDNASLLEKVYDWRSRLLSLDSAGVPFAELANRKRLLKQLDELEQEILADWQD